MVIPDLTLAEARAIVDRALAKARELKQAGAFVVLDAGGNLVSASRIGEGAMASMWTARAKAYVAAAQRAPSLRNATNWRREPALFAAFQQMARDDIFPGPGAMPIRKEGRVVGALSTGGGIGPWTEIPGIDPGQLMVDGHPANAEDLIIAHALQIPYASQHPDVERSVGPRVDERMDDLPHCLVVARGYADGVLAEARRRGLHPGVAVVDEVGQIMQIDRADGGLPMSPDLAEAKALTALNFQQRTLDLGARLPPERLTELRQIVHFKMLTAGGGVPIEQNGQVVGAIGVSGAGGPDQEDEIARLAIAASTAA